ncbi:MAG: PIN domain-containing protein [Candidatus Thermoplasmatota archaeon]|jgi:predicted nucleic acid-binding protein|nr:PIN domain-containing protein [Candidatus Thermoplasmatota archaeon]MDP7266033.1 PIN domain-containing protein [Candidatus Thermoplasmatota archaeon]
MTEYILDSYAWIEYLEGTSQGEAVRELIEDPDNEIHTCSVMVAEVLSKALRANRMDIYENALRALERIPRIVNVDLGIAKRASIIHAKERKVQKDFGLADAFLAAAAEKVGAMIVTGDPHFSGKENVVFLGEDNT